MKNYTNGYERANLVYLAVTDKIKQQLINGNLLSSAERTELKHAFTRTEKMLKMVIDRLGTKEGERIGRMVRDNDITMVPKIKELISPQTIRVDDDRLRDILEIMINDHCVGCTAANWKDCHIYKLNDDLEVSSMYDEPEGLCPYRYMMEQEKAKNTTYGTIFKDNKK